VSQPYDRMAICPAPIKPDERLKDWWVENPWQIAAKGKSLSGYERNRIYLNARAKEFYEISGLTSGADSDGDGRAVVPCDVTGDGMQDFFVRQAGGGTLLLFENQFPKAHWLEVSLRGKTSNSLGIGARVIAEIGSQRLIREVYPANTFKSQAPAHVHFGLGKSAKIDRLTIAWPSGMKQEFKDVAPNRHLRITEGDSALAMLSR
jgi:enediyne biosynthesis protein E4